METDDSAPLRPDYLTSMVMWWTGAVLCIISLVWVCDVIGSEARHVLDTRFESPNELGARHDYWQEVIHQARGYAYLLGAVIAGASISIVVGFRRLQAHLNQKQAEELGKDE